MLLAPLYMFQYCYSCRSRHAVLLWNGRQNSIIKREIGQNHCISNRAWQMSVFPRAPVLSTLLLEAVVQPFGDNCRAKKKIFCLLITKVIILLWNSNYVEQYFLNIFANRRTYLDVIWKNVIERIKNYDSKSTKTIRW